MRLRVGIEGLIAQDFAPLQGQRVGLMTNPSAVDARVISTYEILHRADNVNLVALFAPEHGAFGQAREGEQVASGTDAHTGLTVHSLYGETYRPTEAMLSDIDIMVCDIQDIGARYYTFLWTITHILEACGEYGVRVLVLDRPNPAGAAIGGRGLDPAFSSLVGRYDIPNQHGMTLAELARMHNNLWNPTPAALQVIPCANYSRDRAWSATGRVFVPPSPNMPHISTVQHYPGACLIEGTTLSEGRGTALPFEIVGAPYLHGRDLVDTLNQLDLPGVRFRSQPFTPTTGKHAETPCEGVQVHIVDGDSYQPLLTWLTVIQTIRDRYPDDFGWLPAFPGDERLFFDKLMGSDDPRQQLERGISAATIVERWQHYLTDFETRRAPYLLYI